MSRPSGTQIGSGKEIKASPINADLDNHEQRLQALEALLSGGRVKLSAITNDINTPPSWLSARTPNERIRPAMQSMAIFNQSLKLPFRRGAVTSNVAADNPGWGAPAWGGFVICDQDNDEVHLFSQNTVTGGYTKQTFQMDSGDAPIHAVASANGMIYVSCPGTSKVRRINTLAGSGVVSDFYSLTSINADYGAAACAEKIYLNRHGTYLYLIAKRTTGTADNNFRRVIQINVATQVGAEQSIAETTAGQDIVDLAFVYSGTSTSDDAMVVVGIKTVGSSTGALRRKNESAWGTGSITDSFAALAAGDLLAGICEYGAGVAAVGYYGSVTGSWSRLFVWDDKTGAVGTHAAVQRDTSNTITPDDGSVTSDGERVWWTAGGYVLSYHPSVEATHPAHEAQGGFPSAGTFTTGSGAVYTGYEMLVVGNVGSSTPGEFAVFTV